MGTEKTSFVMGRAIVLNKLLFSVLLSLVVIATPNMPVRAQRPIIEKV